MSIKTQRIISCAYTCNIYGLLYEDIYETVVPCVFCFALIQHFFFLFVSFSPSSASHQAYFLVCFSVFFTSLTCRYRQLVSVPLYQYRFVFGVVCYAVCATHMTKMRENRVWREFKSVFRLWPVVVKHVRMYLCLVAIHFFDNALFVYEKKVLVEFIK